MTSNEELVNYKDIDCVDLNNFGINHDNIRGGLKIWKFEFQPRT